MKGFGGEFKERAVGVAQFANMVAAAGEAGDDLEGPANGIRELSDNPNGSLTRNLDLGEHKVVGVVDNLVARFVNVFGPGGSAVLGKELNNLKRKSCVACDIF